MPPPRILVLFNEPVLPTTHPDAEAEHEILEIVDVVCRELGEANFDVSRLGVNRDPAVLIHKLQARRPDAVFNLFEGTADQSETEATVAGLLDWLRIPYTGAPFAALCLARDKVQAKHLFRGAGLATPAFIVVHGLPLPEIPLDWPVIVKPATQDASVGLDQGSVVTTPEQLEARVASLLERFGSPVLVEQFIRGRELNVALIEMPALRALPISEVLFLDEDPERWPIVTYEAKWAPNSRDSLATPTRYPATVEAALAERLTALAMQAFRLVGCRDYARCDFRVTAAGEPYLLEVNPNPGFHPTAGFASGLKTADISHARFSVALVQNALRRGFKG
jgi:D-alanine-D-alanine ligase